MTDAVREVLRGFAVRAVDCPGGAHRADLAAHIHHLWTPLRRGAFVRTRTFLISAAALHPDAPRWQGAQRHPRATGSRRTSPPRVGGTAGPVGWFNAKGEGAFVVALRSALVAEREAWLYAGAGIVEGSTADGEWAETAVKFRAMRAALGIEA